MTTRHELQRTIVATNKVLEEAVREMDDLILLRNVHPNFRSDYAARMLKESLITREEAKEFIKFIGNA